MRAGAAEGIGVGTRVLRIRLHFLGAVALAAHGALAVLSYAQAPALWSGPDTPRAAAFFERLAQDLPFVGRARLFADHTAVLVAYAIPLAVASAAALAALWLLLRARGAVDAGIVRLVLRWALAFGAVAVLGFPVFTQDFWLSAAWGRMVAEGVNPYHALFAAEHAAGLPLDHFEMTMSYGPLWALASGAVMALAGSSALAAAILFKALLGAAWLGALLLVGRIAPVVAAGSAAPAVAAFGWVPLGVTQTLLEGHNDMAMAVLALLWLHLALRGRTAAPLALTASAVAKYATAPLLLVDAIHVLRQGLGWRAYALRMIAPALFAFAAFALFYRSTGFFDGLRMLGGWHFLRPADAIGALEGFLGIGLAPLRILALAVFPAVAAHSLYRLWRRPDGAALAQAVLAVMCAVLFAAASHVWPWYLVWALAPAALVPRWWLSRFVVGAAVMAPFMVAYWWVPALDDGEAVGALFMYVGAGLWVLATRIGCEPVPVAAAPHALGQGQSGRSAAP
jgi:alpha-1,6-mannosyltransferase